ncbi:MAG: FAD-dependent oxidoreductase [Deltaproteobacteria bacterium]|nr:FAD-dependent oxidoreductase [Deltaproteobacteria bacterium]
MSKNIVIIGGSAAGPKAAARARRLDQKAIITLIQKEEHLSMASCGYPYYIGGTFDARSALLSTLDGALRDPDYFINVKNINAIINTEATVINKENRTVSYKNLITNETGSINYDELIIATGATPKKPPIDGLDLEGVTHLHSMADTDYLRKLCERMMVEKAVVIGGGLIGMEVCEALIESEVEEVTIVEFLPQILPFLDWDLAKLVENHCVTKAVKIITSRSASRFIGNNGELTGIELDDGTIIDCELAVVAVGVQPNIKLAETAGLEIGKFGGIKVNQYMQTSDEHIYAVGDCIETKSVITGQQVLAPMGDLANLEGRVAGENAILGNKKTFPGVLQTGICKIFEYTAGSTGLSETTAKKLGFDCISSVTSGADKPHFMSAARLISRITADRKTGKILGFQCVGMGDVSRQLATAAMALAGQLTIDTAANLDLPYAPPFSPAIDHFIAATHVLQNKMNGLLTGISAIEVKKKIDSDETPFLLDVRENGEYNQNHIGIGETTIPIGELKKRLNELPEDKDKEIICFCHFSLRGYEASLTIRNNGWKNVNVMEGGISAWPYAMKKQ